MDVKNKIFHLLFSLFSVLSFTQNLSVFDVDFNESMERNNFTIRNRNSFFYRMKKEYEDHHFLKVMRNKAIGYEGIPKIIHQIWIGPDKLPKTFLPFMESWTKLHPDWTYKLWTNEDLKKLSPFSEKALENCSAIGCKVDILKYEILHKYGGVYIDIDFECLQPLDIIVENSQFFAALYERNTVGQGIIGSKKDHPFIRQLVSHFKKHQNNDFKKPIQQTGPKFFTNMIQDYFCSSNTDPLLILPISFFHSFPRGKRTHYWKNYLSHSEIIKNFSYPETFAIHYWGHTWVKQKKS